ncbi:hypothetical protein IWT140_00892 [Secundilactobacillus pentosiphilus]|uniref:Uncharacterized protein n=1 Tax=Secundilactobacillus pentosiphilus TaxID=1714682 RepID=A0A1Z5IZI8_9LACO|nr:hypothetical protein [Secundilactobacillus pentosiphilus]GAX03290.1 hypothetical protein IWT140_00892 [Secundilactobacillus pentosiphilus]GAX07056.1 hypothetical protein IWT25_02404 [Secundilactobacillus pentosiphilus]
MKKRHFLSKQSFFGGIVAVTVVYGIDQFPKLAFAATNQLLARADRKDLTEAVFIGVGLLVCLLGLFGMDCFRARHPRVKKSAATSTGELTESASTQQ